MPRRPAAALATVVALAAAIVPGDARAEGELGLVSPRAVGRAGAALVSDDGPAALFACPAAIARRGERRAQLGGLFIDDDVWLSTAAHPRISDRGPSELVPLAGAVGHLGPVVVGVAIATTASLDRRLPAPEPGLPADTVSADFPHRHAALEARWTRRTAAAGLALRATEWLALGATATVARVDAVERRRVWAGFGGRDLPSGNPVRDVDVTVTGADRLIPGAALGALVAPPEVPLELAVGASWAGDVHLDGDATVAWGRTPPPAGSATTAPTVVAADATARARVASPLALQAGVRWVGERHAIEAGAAAWTYLAADVPAWHIDGARVVDDTGASAPLDRLPSRIGRRSHGALRVSGDLEILPGFLWLSAGYGWRGAAQATRATTLGGVDRGGHILAAGAELTAGAATVTVGWSRQLARETVVGAPGLPADNPFAAGAPAANLGRHGHSRDVVAVGLELAMP